MQELKDFTLDQLKSLVYDNLRNVQILRNQNEVLEKEINAREQELAKQRQVPPVPVKPILVED
jgi:hypothetical protein